MRQVHVHAPRGRGDRVVDVARGVDAWDVMRHDAEDEDRRPIDAFVVHVPNDRLGDFVGALETIPDIRVTVLPVGSLTLEPSSPAPPSELSHVTARSPLEVFIGGLQSVGTWTGILGYAAAAGVVVWLGLFTNIVFLLVGAMLIAPFAGPAMNAAIATARGDASLLGRSILRYAASLAVTAVVAGLLSLAFRQEVATQQMTSVANISTAAFLLPIAAGGAGALNLSLADRNSLVSGAAVGLLVAASLAPPAGLIGMATVVGDWAMLKSSAFLLCLQLVGINLSGAVVFRLFGLDPSGPRYEHGTPRAVRAAALASIVGLGALLAWQFGSPQPELQRATIAQRIHGTVERTLEDEPDVRFVEAAIRFTRADFDGGHPALVQVWVQRRPGVDIDNERLRRRVSARLSAALADRRPGTIPLIDVSVLSPAVEPDGEGR